VIICKQKSKEFADLLKLQVGNKFGSADRKICKLQKILGLQSANPQIATHAEGTQM
jgi:hypothetical protein